MGHIINTEFIVRRMAGYDRIPVKQRNRLVHLTLRRVYGNVSRGEDVRIYASHHGQPVLLFKVFKRDFDVRRANSKSLAKQPRRVAERRRRKLRLTLKKDLRLWPKN